MPNFKDIADIAITAANYAVSEIIMTTTKFSDAGIINLISSRSRVGDIAYNTGLSQYLGFVNDSLMISAFNNSSESQCHLLLVDTGKKLLSLSSKDSNFDDIKKAITENIEFKLFNKK